MSSIENPIRDAIQEAIDEHEVILFMKGTPERPMCGFSAPLSVKEITSGSVATATLCKRCRPPMT